MNPNGFSNVTNININFWTTNPPQPRVLLVLFNMADTMANSVVRPPQAKQANYVVATAQLVIWVVS